jgi:ribosomal protein S12 methylthiotransferase
MAIQAGISLAHNGRRVGQTVDVLVEGPDPETPHLWLGHGRFQAPEVDGVVRFSLPPAMPEPLSPIVRVAISSADAYDLSGELVA